MGPLTSKKLAKALDELIRQSSAETLQVWEPVILHGLSAVGLSVAAVLHEEEEISESSLVLACKHRFFFKYAFDELLRIRSEAWLKNLFRKWGTPVDQVEDVVHSLYIDLLEGALDTYDREKGIFRRWLITVAYHHCVSEVHRWRRRHRLVSLDGLPEPYAAGLSPDSEVEYRELEERMKSALGRFPPDERQVLTLTMNGRLPDEIAHEMGVPIQKVYQLRFKARRRMEQELVFLSEEGSKQRVQPSGPAL